jgi:hypothetical protein
VTLTFYRRGNPAVIVSSGEKLTSEEWIEMRSVFYSEKNNSRMV